MARYKGITGFTLVELAIVMTIIGLLIGGVLKGQELIHNSRVTNTIAQIKAYNAAIMGFKDIYSSLPGDLPNAAQRIPGCTLGCQSSISGWGRPGDGVIGDVTWQGYQQTNGVTPGNAIGSEVGYEVFTFWMHMLQANLITGVQNRGIHEAINYEFGITHPKAEIGGGFMVGHSVEGYGGAGPGHYGIPNNAISARGVLLFLVPGPRTHLGDANNPWNNIISAIDAAQLDRKMDDGKPSTGIVRGGGDPNAAAIENRCYDTSTTMPLYTNSNKPVCKLILEMPG